MTQERESLEFDILYVGAGPANLSSAIHLQRLINQHNRESDRPLEPSIAIIDKGRYAGAHLLSGALLDPRALEEFFPDYRARGCPIEATVSNETIWYLSAKRRFSLPFIPPAFSNTTSLMVSLSKLGGWLAEQAEELGIQLFDSTAAVAPCIEDGRLAGVFTDDKGVAGNGEPKANYEQGLLLKSKVTVIGEGAAGSLTRQLTDHFPSLRSVTPQRYETGVKETWRIPEGRIMAGEVYHTFGYPHESAHYGGGWVYAFSPTLVSIGVVSSPDATNPTCDPHKNLQRFKEHPLIAALLPRNSLLESGARTITSGGFDAMPQLYGNGFLLTGESAGMVNMQRHKGIHLAMKSGILAAETLFACLIENNFSTAHLQQYTERFRTSWAYEELYAVRNYRKAFDKGLYRGLIHAGIKISFAGEKRRGEKQMSLDMFDKSAEAAIPEVVLTATVQSKLKQKQRTGEDAEIIPGIGCHEFTKDYALYYSGIQHEENQPCHLHIKQSDIDNICLKQCTTKYGNPCQHFCPAGVYEIIPTPRPSLRLKPSNCLHCKTCEVADPYGVIRWDAPEGGSGPGYRVG